MTPTLRYLFKETALRWRTRPSSPLARAVLTYTLAATAGGFLAGFAASADVLRTQLARFGFNTMVVRTIGPASLAPFPGRLPADHWAAPLAADGRLAVFEQTPLVATTNWGASVPVFTASWPVLSEMQPSTAPRSGEPPPAIWLTRNWPEGRIANFKFGQAAGGIDAIARPAEGPWRALLDGDALLLPAETLPPVDARGAVEVVLFTPSSPTVLSDWVRAVRHLLTAETGGAPAIQDPGPLRAALAALEHGQALWRTIILGLLGLGVILVFAAIGILEHHQVRFAQALLRSLGVRARLLWTATLGENLLLANAALAAALLTVHLGATALLAKLPAFDAAAGTRLNLDAAVFLAVVVNVGVLASLVPLAVSLRRPIGTMLA